MAMPLACPTRLARRGAETAGRRDGRSYVLAPYLASSFETREAGKIYALLCEMIYGIRRRPTDFMRRCRLRLVHLQKRMPGARARAPRLEPMVLLLLLVPG